MSTTEAKTHHKKNGLVLKLIVMNMMACKERERFQCSGNARHTRPSSAVEVTA